MRVEIKRRLPVSSKKAFDYLADFRTWPMWYSGVLEIVDPDSAAWDKKGDSVRFAYTLLGRRLEGEAFLDVIEEAEYVKMHSTMPMVGWVSLEWVHEDVDEEAFTLVGIMETDEPTKVFGKLIDRMVVPKILERDLTTTFDNLEETFALGVPD